MPSKTVMIVEDEVTIRTAYTDGLTSVGYTVLSAANGAEALSIGALNPPDLILLDLYMPVMTGQQFLEQIRKQSWGGSTPIIVLTNSDSAIDLVESMKALVTDYLVKSDTDIETLVKVVEQLIGIPHPD